MKKSKTVWSLILIIICIIVGIVILFIFNKEPKDTNWNIKIYEYWNNPLAGRRMHENRKLLIDSNKCIGKVTYLDEKMEYKETKQFKIKKEDINKILELAKKGETTKEEATAEKTNNETYIVYKIDINSKITYVNSKIDKKNTISNLFID